MPGGPSQQNAARDLGRRSRWNLLRITQEFDDFLEVLLGFIDAGHVGEGHPAMCPSEAAFGVPNRHGAAGAALHTLH